MTHLRIPQHAFLLTGILAALAALAGALLFLAPQSARQVFAASRATGTITCNLQADFAHCGNLDPVKQMCATPDTTTVSQNIVDPTGTIVGRVDRRFSQTCHTWWGRVLDYRHIKGASIHIQVGNKSYSLSFNDVAYSDMVFDPPNAPAPSITGTLTTNGKPDPALSVTLPAVTIPTV